MMNKNLKLTIFAVLAIFLSTSFSLAQQAATETKISPEKQALIKEYYEITGGREAVTKNLDAVFANLNRTLSMIMSANIQQNSHLTAAQKADLQKSMPEMVARMSKRFEEELNKELDFAKVVEEINYPLLDKFFTEAELKDLIAFYQSPTGRKTITIQPQIYTEAATRMNAVLIPAMEKIMKKVTDEETDAMIKKTKRGK